MADKEKTLAEFMRDEFTDAPPTDIDELDKEDGPDAEEEESPAAEDNPDAPSEDDDEAEEVEQDSEESPEGEDEEGEEGDTGDDTDPEDDEEGEPDDDEEDPDELDPDEVVFYGETEDGDKVPITRREAQNGYLRHSAATRKFQEAAEIRESVQGQLQRQREVAQKISQDEDMVAFLKSHPDVWPYLMDNLDAAEQLVGDPDAVAEFWEDYETITSSPRLAQRFHEQGSPRDPEVNEAQQRAQFAQQVADELDKAVLSVAQALEVEDDEVRNKVSMDILKLAGLKSEQPDAAEMMQVMERAYRMYFVEKDDGVYIDPALIIDRMKTEANTSSPSSKKKDRKEEHNRKVDEKLSGGGSNKSPKSMKGPGPRSKPEALPEINSFTDAMRAFD